MRRIGSSTNYEPLDGRAVPGLAAARRWTAGMRDAGCAMRECRPAPRIPHPASRIPTHRNVTDDRAVALRWWGRLVRRPLRAAESPRGARSEEHTSELQSPCNLVCRLLLEKKKKQQPHTTPTR